MPSAEFYKSEIFRDLYAYQCGNYGEWTLTEPKFCHACGDPVESIQDAEDFQDYHYSVGFDDGYQSREMEESNE